MIIIKNNIDIRIRTKIMFWLDNFNILTIPILIPDINMTFEEKLNSIIRGLLFLGIIFTLVFNDSKYILFVLLIMII